MPERETPLSPGARTSLRDVLAPPQDYELERAFGTAYSLDAATLIAIPLFADGSDASEQTKPLGVQRIFELGKRITLLVQGDRVQVPPVVRKELLALVEDVAVACAAPTASFHPKLLVLEFRRPGTGDRIRRVVVSSRNLTVDDSWDFVVVLEEAPATGILVPGLGDAVKGLAPFVTSDERARQECHRVGALLETMRFEPLQPFDNVAVRLFTPEGLEAGEVLATLTGDQLLVISPFVGVAPLKHLAAQAGAGSSSRTLVTRPVGVDDAVFDRYQVFQLRADLIEQDVPDSDRGAAESPDNLGRLRGLHAKMYFATDKARTAVVLTSANATPSGWSRNVEIALFGSVDAKKLTVTDLLRRRAGLDDGPGFADLLTPLSKDATADSEQDPDWTRAAGDALACATARGVLTAGADRLTLEVEILLHPEASPWPAGIHCLVAPHAYPGAAAPLRKVAAALVSTIDLPREAGITRFLTVNLSKNSESRTLTLLMNLQGERQWTAEDARNELVREMRPQFLRDLAWKIGVPVPATPEDGDVTSLSAGSGERWTANPPILERLLLNLHSNEASAYVATIDGLMAAVAEDPEFEQWVTMWNLLRTVVG